MKTSFVALLCGALLTSVVCATDLYVSPTGDDTASGASGAPLRTLAGAQSAVRKQLAGTLTEDINVHVAAGVYMLSAPLVLTASDSGKNGFKVNWLGTDAVMSGGLKVTGWQAGSDGVYSASVPIGTKSRNLYVNGNAAQYARRKINRKDFTYTSNGMTWTNGANDWLQTTAGIAGAEIRWISSFTDRYAQIRSVANRQLVMVQTAWQNQIIGYDTVNNPNADFGVWVQNARALLSDNGQYYLDSAAGKVYYKPMNGEDMNTASTYLGILEAVLVIGGTYDNPAHDITVQGFNIAHSTWLKPGQGYGYADQQTGGHIGENKTYPAFEASRPHWYQMPSAVQVSAAQRITLSGNNYTSLGAGGVGLGNDPNAHMTGVGLGLSNVTVSDGYFAQVMGNGITAGGIQADAHHPSDSRMVVKSLTISGNIFYNTSALFSSTVPIFASYFQYSEISHNDIYLAPYSAICIGYGWGSNDAGGSPEYQSRGLYNYQPKYSTPTTFQNVLVQGNLLHGYGLSHTDLGGIYTLSKSPSTRITENYLYDSSGYSLYNDEGSSGYIMTNNMLLARGNWHAINFSGGTAGNLTTTGNWGNGASGGDNKAVSSVSQAGTAGMRVAYRAGVLPGKRNGRPVSNDPSLRDGNVDVSSSNGQISVQLSNFDDVAFTGVTFSVSGGSLTLSGSAPTSVPANGAATATYRYSGSKPNVQVSVRYTNPRTGRAGTLTASG